MKKIILMILITIFLLTGCIITNNFDAYHHLALNAIAQGSKESIKEYAALLIESAETNQQKSIALMVSGFGNFLTNNYNDALSDFSISKEYKNNDESIIGIILTYFMLSQYEMVNYQLDDLDMISKNWQMILNFQELTKYEIYEVCAISNAILRNKKTFDVVKTKLEPETIQKMEGFFFE